MIEKLLQKECNLEFFRNNGYVRKKCKSCGSYFWTLDSNQEFCGDQPCVKFSFINDTITKQPLSLSDVRERFLTFFKKNNHSEVFYPETGNRCPVIARWRSDIYLTIASIADFQPHVTSGEVPPPANPLVISQPCIRLNDLEEVGISGRHLTTFEMMGHHAFNKSINEIYWKEETASYCDEFFRNYIGIPRENINYKEHLWIGGGNAGPCIEVLSGGLEIATLVFMNMKEEKNGNIDLDGVRYTQNPLNIVDTGYGLERIAWFTQGTSTVYETVFPEVIDFIKNHSRKNAEISKIYALSDHTKCLAFMLGDGIVPSNVKAGYLARLIIRRSLRFIEQLKISSLLKELVNIQLDLLERDFPSLKKRKDQIDEILDIETKKYKNTLSKGRNYVKRILNEKKSIGKSELELLYDTHGMQPEIVKDIAQKHGVDIEIPKNFDSMIAELHSHEKAEDEKIDIEKNLPNTIPLYYSDHYTKEFDAEVIWANENKIILNQTAFYPEGGGQPGDNGILTISGQKIEVKKVYKEGNSIIHLTDKKLKIGDKINGAINWDHRYKLMKHHTGTHVVNGALRKLFGEHIWQAGSQLAPNEARFDFSHYKPISDNEIKKIEKIANDFIKQGIEVEKKVMTRNEAEKEFGFRLFQGGVPPGNLIRVLNIPEVDVEACGGTHLNNIKEIEKIRIIKAERIQDGVNRIIFAAGEMVDKFFEKENIIFENIVKILTPYFEIERKDDVSDQLKETAKIFSVTIIQLENTIKRFIKETESIEKIKVKTVIEAANRLFNQWKKTQKQKKLVSSDNVDNLIKKAEKISGTNIKIIIAKTDNDAIAMAGKIIKQRDFIVHIFDGNKLVSAASENIKIDLRQIAPKIGQVLGGSGGGKPNLTQCGGPNINKINEALELAKKLSEELILSNRV